jgi:1,4-dihydroxy-2-naphthoate octaprenyltransferase
MVLSMSSPIFVATAFAWYTHGAFDLPLFFLTWIGATTIFVSTDLFNDYYDHVLKADDVNSSPTPFSGGSRVIQEGLVPAKTMLLVAIIGLIIAAIIGLYLNFVLDGITILVLGLIGFFLVYFYTAPPIKFCYRGFGEIVQGFGFGPIILFGVYFVQTHVITRDIVLISIPFGFVGSMVGLILSIPDYETDKQVNKKNLIILFGKKRAVIIYGLLLLFTFISDAILIILNVLPPWCLLIFIIIPLAILSFSNGLKHFNDTKLFLFTSVLSLIIAAVHNFLFIIGLLLEKIY